MQTTTKVNKENVLLGLDGFYNDDVHKKLSQIIHNISLNKVRTNPTLSLDDLKQETWAHIFKIIKDNLNKGIELEIGYLVTIAKTTTLSECQKESKRLEYMDDYSVAIFNSADNNTRQGSDKNVAKAKLEYELASRYSNEEKQTILRLALEGLLDSIDDESVKNLIIIKYVEEFNGTSVKINQMYNEFYNSLDVHRRSILNNMTKFTNNAAFKALGMRATDNRSTNIRKDMKMYLSFIND